MMIVFLDMDGVLVNFCKAAFEVHGRVWTPDQPLKYDFWHEWGLCNDDFWKKCSSVAFWTDLEKTAHSRRLYMVCEKYADQVFFSSAPCVSEASAMGKLLWLSIFLMRTVQPSEYFLGAAKRMLAGPGRLLVDDRPEHVNEWEKLGGDAILWPAPTNRSHYTRENALEAVEAILKKGKT